MSERTQVPVNSDLLGAIGAESRWSDAVVVGDLVFVTGQLGWDKQTGEFVEGIEAQTELALENLKSVIESTGASLDDVVQTRVYLTEHDDYHRYESIYARYFVNNQPARVTVVVADLIHHALFDIEAIAVKRSG
jgi:2-iminobutanoate/2-iminopropanoate deaminase